MTKEVIFGKFAEMFPLIAPDVKSYKKIGSKTISIRMNNGKTRTFLYNNPDNWNFGTKPWRKKPEPIAKGTKPGITAKEAHEAGKKLAEGFQDGFAGLTERTGSE